MSTKLASFSGLSVVIPVYNGALTLPILVARLAKTLPALTDSYELILVDDGSPDSSWEKIQSLSRENQWVHGIRLMRNFGQHNALLCGVRAANNEIIITMDDDLQHPPEEIHKLIEKLGDEYDVVYGVPAHLPHSFFRNLLSQLTKRILAFVMGIPSVREIGAFRAFRSKIIRAFTTYQSPSLILDVLLSWGTTRFTSTPVEESPRQEGQSNYNFRQLAQQAFLILTGYSTAPLRFASTLGFFLTLVGVGVFIYVIIAYFAAGSIPGFPFLASLIALFSGTQMFALGIFGEYLARIFDRSMDRPTYIIENTTDSVQSGQIL